MSLAVSAAVVMMRSLFCCPQLVGAQSAHRRMPIPIINNPFVAMVPLAMFLGGWYLDKLEDQRMTMFRNKSALYGRELKPDEKQPWP